MKITLHSNSKKSLISVTKCSLLAAAALFVGTVTAEDEIVVAEKNGEWNVLKIDEDGKIKDVKDTFSEQNDAFDNAAERIYEDDPSIVTVRETHYVNNNFVATTKLEHVVAYHNNDWDVLEVATSGQVLDRVDDYSTKSEALEAARYHNGGFAREVIAVLDTNWLGKPKFVTIDAPDYKEFGFLVKQKKTVYTVAQRGIRGRFTAPTKKSDIQYTYQLLSDGQVIDEGSSYTALRTSAIDLGEVVHTVCIYLKVDMETAVEDALNAYGY